MKKLLMVWACLCLAIATHAQHPHWGIKGGINLANLDVERGSNPDWKAGIHIGGLAHIHLSEHFAIQPELMYSNQGAERRAGNTEYTTKLHYMNVPVLLQFMTGSGFRLQTGPQFGVLMSAKSKVNDTETTADDNFKTPDLSWSFGASYVTMKGLGFDARYNHGISNINDATDNDYRNRVFQFGVFYQFRVSEYRRK
jgi:Outer membrane protein beta-barrel domain